MSVSSDLQSLHYTIPYINKVERPLVAALSTFNKLSTIDESARKELIPLLNQAFAALREVTFKSPDGVIPKNLQWDAAQIFFMYGSCIGDQKASSRHMFLMALAVQFMTAQQLKSIPSIKCENLEQLQNFLEGDKEAWAFAEFEEGDKAAWVFRGLLDAIKPKSADCLVNDLYDYCQGKFPTVSCDLLGRTLSRLSCSYRNLPDLWKDSKSFTLLIRLSDLAIELFARDRQGDRSVLVLEDRISWALDLHEARSSEAPKLDVINTWVKSMINQIHVNSFKYRCHKKCIQTVIRLNLLEGKKKLAKQYLELLKFLIRPLFYYSEGDEKIVDELSKKIELLKDSDDRSTEPECSEVPRLIFVAGKYLGAECFKGVFL